MSAAHARERAAVAIISGRPSEASSTVTKPAWQVEKSCRGVAASVSWGVGVAGMAYLLSIQRSLWHAEGAGP
jgi:hypothetical protein